MMHHSVMHIVHCGRAGKYTPVCKSCRDKTGELLLCRGVKQKHDVAYPFLGMGRSPDVESVLLRRPDSLRSNPVAADFRRPVCPFWRRKLAWFWVSYGKPNPGHKATFTYGYSRFSVSHGSSRSGSDKLYRTSRNEGSIDDRMIAQARFRGLSFSLQPPSSKANFVHG